MLSGEIIHRNFYSIYGPAQYYVIAGLFKFLGQNFMTARLYDLAVRTAILTMLFYIIRRQCSLLLALIFTAVGGMWMMSLGNYLFQFSLAYCFRYSAPISCRGSIRSRRCRPGSSAQALVPA